jgi:hypothetical protein
LRWTLRPAKKKHTQGGKKNIREKKSDGHRAAKKTYTSKKIKKRASTFPSGEL